MEVHAGVRIRQRNLTKREQDEMKKIFNKLDENGDGRVSVHELARAMRYLGMNPTKIDIKRIMKEADKNGDGYVNYPEFERIMAGETLDIDYEQELLLGAFRKFDLNGDGFISKEELKQVLTKMGEKMPEEEASMMVEEADLNGDGVISYEEFVQVCCKKPEEI